MAHSTVSARFSPTALRSKREEHTGFKQSHAFVIGINHYPNLEKALISAVPDAWRAARLLWELQGFDHVYLLLNPACQDLQSLLDWLKNPSRESQIPLELSNTIASSESADRQEQRILEDFGTQQRANQLIYFHHDRAFSGINGQDSQSTQADSLVFYYAGHGEAGEYAEGPAGFLLPTDAHKEQGENDNRISMDELLSALEAVNCQHTLLVLDCCFAGKFRHIAPRTRFSTAQNRKPLTEERFQQFKNKRAWQVLVSAGPDEEASDGLSRRDEHEDFDGSHLPHSPFALAFFEALQGKADFHLLGEKSGDGVLTANELKSYLFERVRRMTFKDRRFNQQHPDLFPMQEHEGGEFIFINPNHHTVKFAQWQNRNPYKGLKAYEKHDWPIFCGRQAARIELEKRLVEYPIVLVSAPSGYGKSSLVKAGLLPYWEQAGYEVSLFRTSQQPYSGPLIEHQDPNLSYTYWSGIAGLHSVIDASESMKHLIFLDQYEEIFSVSDPNELRHYTLKLTDLIEQAFREADKEIKLILSIRSDFEWQFSSSTIGQLLESRCAERFSSKPKGYHYRLAPMEMFELREALLKPASFRGFEFESEALETEILEEISASPAALSLLSATMSYLFAETEKQINANAADKRLLTRANYLQIGGISGTLSKHATKVFEQLTIDQQKAFKKLFMRMLQPQSSGVIRRKIERDPLLDELDHPGDAFDKLLNETLEVFVDNQLIVRGSRANNTEVIELAHDALISHWDLARTWIAEIGGHTILLQRQLWQAVIDLHQEPDPNQKERSAYIPNSLPGENAGAELSLYWDSDPKLIQLVGLLLLQAKELLLKEVEPKNALQLAFAKIPDQNGFSKEVFVNACKETDKIPDIHALIISGVSNQFLDILLAHTDHWLNQKESRFIKSSWKLRAQRIIERAKDRETRIENLKNLTQKELDVAAYQLEKGQLEEASGTFFRAEGRGILNEKVKELKFELGKRMLERVEKDIYEHPNQAEHYPSESYEMYRHMDELGFFEIKTLDALQDITIKERVVRLRSLISDQMNLSIKIRTYRAKSYSLRSTYSPLKALSDIEKTRKLKISSADELQHTLMVIQRITAFQFARNKILGPGKAIPWEESKLKKFKPMFKVFMSPKEYDSFNNEDEIMQKFRTHIIPIWQETSEPKMKVINDQFELSETPITKAQYRYYLHETQQEEGETKPFFDPKTNVTFFEACQYANWLSQKRGLKPYYTIRTSKVKHKSILWIMSSGGTGYRLPTKKEWQRVANAVKDQDRDEQIHKYFWSRKFTLNSRIDPRAKPLEPCGFKSPNHYGIFDMGGNIFEWCDNWNSQEFKDQIYSLLYEEEEDTITEDLWARALGGSFVEAEMHGRKGVLKSKIFPVFSKHPNLGFRLARTP